MLVLIRSPLATPSPRGTYRRLVVLTGARVLAAIENADDEDKMPAGTYELVMATMATKTDSAGKRVKGLWLPGGQLFGHPANHADQLEGCWAPGYVALTTKHGVGQSRFAMAQIFRDLGGFEEKRRVPFTCIELDAQEADNLSFIAPSGPVL